MNPTHPTAPASMATHTPTPWDYQLTVSANGPVPQVQTVPIGPEGGRYSTLICTLSRTGEKSGANIANAQFIVRACNSHAQLVESLQAIINQADAQFRAGDRHATFNRQTIDAIRAALTAAQS